jgi:hypothetical protein
MDQTTAALDDRFARWPRLRARLLLFAVALLVIAAALVPIKAGTQEKPVVGFVGARPQRRRSARATTIWRSTTG